MTMPALVRPATGAMIASLSTILSAGAAAEPPEDPVPPTAQPVETPPPTLSPEEEAGRFYTTLRGLGEATFRTNLDDSPGDVAVYRTGVGVGIAGPLSERLRLSVNLDSELSWYDFRDATGLVPGTDDPISEAYRLTLRPQLVVIESADLSWFVGGILESAGEYDADFGETITGGGFGGVRYRLSDDVALSFGLAARSRLDDEALFIPLIGVEWDLNERVTIATDGLGAKLTARLSEEWAFTASGGWELRDYRLDSDGPLPDGVLRDTRVPIGVGFAWRPSRAVSVELLGGAVVWQEYTVDDADGMELSEINSDPTGFLRLSARITF